MPTIIKTIENALTYDISNVQVEEYWNLGETPELKMHSLHAYPAKFRLCIEVPQIYCFRFGIPTRKNISFTLGYRRLGNLFTAFNVLCPEIPLFACCGVLFNKRYIS